MCLANQCQPETLTRVDMNIPNTQIPIDFSPSRHARRSDPATSKDSAGRVREFAGGQCADILAILKKYSPLGAEQIADLVGIEAYAARKRLADLEHVGLAYPLTETRKTATGRSERLWQAS